MKSIALLGVLVAVAAGTYVGNWLWWQHAADVARSQLHASVFCQTYPSSPLCR